MEKITHHVERQHGHQNKFEQTLLVKSELAEKHQYDILNKVVLKHHNAAQKQKKDEKLEKEKR
jgi:hypothetical protein